ncbi:hypothetical protein DFH06DRAFT_1222302 [Mycena polygramma]|nr:hypothetical protein DFH06DRAFT_1222302 [Mycena polygramma]
MHQLLRLENLSSLPASLRRVAMPAARGSWTELNRLLLLLRGMESGTAWTNCLPIFYANLDPAGIPSGEDLDTPAARRAVLVMNPLRLLPPSYASVGMDLWPRVWEWTNFLHTYRDCIPPLRPQQDIAVDLLYVVTALINDPEIAAVMGQTTGVRAVLMRAFASLLDSEPSSGENEFAHLCTILRDFMDAHRPANLAEILDATDGPHALASLAVRYIKLFMPERRAALTTKPLFFYDGIVTFVSEVTEGAGDNWDIAGAFLSAGIVAPLTAAICALSESTVIHKGIEGPLLQCFQLLVNLFLVPGSHTAIRDAIDAGLLHAMIHASVVCDRAEELEESGLKTLITTVLPDATVYYSVLVALETQLPEVAEIAKLPGFKQSAMYDDWVYFANLAKERVKLLNHFKSDHPSRKACDNMECGVIRNKTEFQRCSHCQLVYYCSSDCQTQDWESGHRETCHSLRICMLKNSDFSPRTLWFLRWLLHSDSYLLTTTRQLCSRIELIRAYSEDTIVSILDYRNGVLSVDVKTIGSERGTCDQWEVYWDEHAARMARSGGRMELHVMRIWDGSRPRQFMFPQRLDRPVLHDGLVRILNKLPRCADPKKEVEKLVATPEYNARQQIH